MRRKIYQNKQGNFKGIGVHTTTEQREKNSPSIHRQQNNSTIAKKPQTTYILDQIKNKVMGIERDEWKVEFSWVKAHAGQRGIDPADRLAKEATSSKDTEEC